MRLECVSNRRAPALQALCSRYAYSVTSDRSTVIDHLSLKLLPFICLLSRAPADTQTQAAALSQIAVIFNANV